MKLALEREKRKLKIERNRDTVHCTVYFYGVKEKLTKKMERRKEREILCSPYENFFLKHFFKDFPFLLTASGICDTVSQEQKNSKNICENT